MVSGRGLIGAFRRRIPRPLLLVAAFALFIANSINIGADFSGMDGMEDLYLQFALHEAFVQVNEAGTKAAAATVGGSGSQGSGSLYPPVPPVFRADHPFVYLIQDNRTGSILFMGQLANPTQNAGTPVPTPQLAIAQSAGSLIVSWPYPSTPWTLQQSPDLNPTNWISWTQVQAQAGGWPYISAGAGWSYISNDGTNNFITITPSAGNLFFRLSQQ